MKKNWWERGPLTFEGLLIALVLLFMLLLAGLLAVNAVHAATLSHKTYVMQD